MSDNIIKTFNTVGPCVPSEHYMLPVLPRQPEIDEMIDGKFYFILHAPRQSGKTTLLDALTDSINADGKMYALACSLMGVRGILDRNESMTTVVSQINAALFLSQEDILRQKAYIFDNLIGMNAPDTKVRFLLNYLCESLDKDLVIFFDEADCFTDTSLVTFLSQIRDAYNTRHKRGNKFPRSMALVGLRDIRDYLAQARPDAMSKGIASPFNIKKKALTLANFTLDEIEIL
ncbi:MAG: ATP-binding protein, partial [Deltaproteobacteria bacterium]|nr:ATP-binding protein [Deltaproteobacteria bacterium]